MTGLRLHEVRAAQVGVSMWGVSVDLCAKYACSVTASVSCGVIAILCKLAMSKCETTLAVFYI